MRSTEEHNRNGDRSLNIQAWKQTACFRQRNSWYPSSKLVPNLIWTRSGELQETEIAPLLTTELADHIKKYKNKKSLGWDQAESLNNWQQHVYVSWR